MHLIETSTPHFSACELTSCNLQTMHVPPALQGDMQPPTPTLHRTPKA
jgi:hypothetical protein